VPRESNAGVGDRKRAAQKAPEADDRQTDIQSVYYMMSTVRTVN